MTGCSWSLNSIPIPNLGSLKVVQTTRENNQMISDTEILAVNIKDVLGRFLQCLLQISYREVSPICAFAWAVKAWPEGGGSISIELGKGYSRPSENPDNGISEALYILPPVAALPQSTGTDLFNQIHSACYRSHHHHHLLQLARTQPARVPNQPQQAASQAPRLACLPTAAAGSNTVPTQLRTSLCRSPHSLPSPPDEKQHTTGLTRNPARKKAHTKPGYRSLTINNSSHY
ncbi:hypothetical protein KEM48_009462 [Puccinia striiformis f. sp. tritici PST-130]|nr:hypothetical protein KEM48_009462 [Puccinia striiformis f. sp. tritici PST-130]